MQSTLFSYNMQWINNKQTMRVHVNCTQQCSTVLYSEHYAQNNISNRHINSRTQYSDKYWNLTIEIKPSLENVLV